MASKIRLAWESRDSGLQHVAYCQDGIMRACAFRFQDQTIWNLELATIWPGGAKDWRIHPSQFASLAEAKEFASVRITGK